MSTPETIYLIPGEDIEGYPGMVWCDDPAPSYADDPEEAVKYVRADEVQRLQARVARLELEEVGAEKAFAAVSDKKSAAESRVVELEKSIRSLMTELHGKKRNEAAKAGGDL